MLIRMIKDLTHVILKSLDIKLCENAIQYNYVMIMMSKLMLRYMKCNNIDVIKIKPLGNPNVKEIHICPWTSFVRDIVY